MFIQYSKPFTTITSSIRILHGLQACLKYFPCNFENALLDVVMSMLVEFSLDNAPYVEI